MQCVDSEASRRRSSEKGQPLWNLLVARRWPNRASIIRQDGPERSYRRADRESIPERIAVAAHLTHIFGVELSRHAVNVQRERSCICRGDSTSRFGSVRIVHRHWLSECESLDELRP